MQCPDCKRLRHVGECEPVYEDEPDALEMLAIDAEQARDRYLAALAKHKTENGHDKSF